MYTVADILRPEFARSWHEGVAVVQEVAAALGHVTTVPAPDDLLLEEDGTLTLGFASEGGEHPVASLARLLGGLLEGVQAPAALQDLAFENSGPAPAQATAEGFSRALAFYERPDRASDMRAVVSRLAASRAALNADLEIERLREKITNPPEPEPWEQPGRPSTSRRPPHVAVAAAIVVVLGVGLLATLRASRFTLRAPAEVASPAAGNETAPANAVSAGTSGPAERVESQPASAVVQAGNAKSASAPPAAIITAPAAASGPAPRFSTASVKTPPISRAPGRVAGPVLRTVQPVQPVLNAVRPAATRGENRALLKAGPTSDIGIVRLQPDPAEAVRPTAGMTDDSVSAWLRVAPREPARGAGPKDAADAAENPRVYSGMNTDVKPPRLSRSQFPNEPRPDAGTGYFDIVVDEAGAVEIVKLISPEHRYHDRMLVAAAKAWKFEPALLNGRAVKYRVRIPIILQEIIR